jgi:cytochrome c5
VQLRNFNSTRYAIFVIFLVLILGLRVLATPSKSHAQGGTAAQDGTLAAMPPAAPSQPKPVVELPDGDGKAIATEFCQDCHRLTNVAKARKAPDEWHDTVQTMMDRGARLPQDKVDALVAYLAKNFGPKTEVAQDAAPPAAVPPSATAPSQLKPQVELPDGDGKAIATENCQACHKLTNLTKAHKSLDDWRDTVQTMMDRGANLPPDKLDTLLQYLAKNFGPKTAAPPTGTASPDAPPAAASPSNQ